MKKNLILFILFLFAPALTKAEYVLPEENDIYRQAILDSEKQNWDLVKILEENGPNHTLNNFLLWKRLSDPASNASFEELSNFIKNNPSWPQIITIRKNAEAAINEAFINNEIEQEKIISWFKIYPPLTTKGMLVFAETLKKIGKKQDYINLVRKAWLESDFSFSEEKNFLKKYKKILRNKDHSNRFNRLLWNRRLVQAKNVLKLLKGQEKLLAQARYALATKNKPSLALAKLPKKLQTDPDVLYERIRYRRANNDYDGMIKLIKNPFFAKGNNPQKWWNELYRATLYLLEKKDYSKAYNLIAKHPFTKGNAYVQAEWMSGWIALRFNKKINNALKHFSAMQKNVSTPVSKAKAHYWIARAFDAKKMTDEAKKHYKIAASFITSFYGQLAADKIYLNSRPPLPKTPKNTNEQKENLLNNELLKTAISLEQIIPVPETKNLYLQTFYTLKKPQEVAALLNILQELKRFDVIVPIARASRQKNNEMGSIAYPIIKIPVNEKIEKSLVLSIIRQESSFNPKAISPVGAHGMMQIMPYLAQKISGESKKSFKKEKLINDIDYNLKLGVLHLNNLLQTYNGFYIPTIAAYNAGEPAVNRWQKLRGTPWKNHDIDKIIDWIEFIPYEETKNYVQRVLENLYIYRRLTGEHAPIGKWDNL